ncbi:MAG: DegT/DnrJ/EryC1/StrS family aminotransferase [Armatimonadota bacterium]
MIYPLASSTWDNMESEAVVDVLHSGRFTMGARVRDFEKRFADYFGSRYAVMVNSGSSANLLAVAAMRYKSGKRMNPGDEVIVPAVSWSTTYYPLHQYGLKLRFVDINLDSLCLDLDAVEDSITSQTCAILAVNLLGSSNDYSRLQQLCDKHDLILLEDNCESMGATYGGRFTGTFGLCGTFSMFFSHHICTMEGGMVTTDDEELSEIVTSLRAHGWTRELPAQNHVCSKDGSAFNDLYRFVLPGYNVRPLEVSAAVGMHQMDKLDDLLAGRRQNARKFTELFGGLDFVRIQKPVGDSSWFGFSLILDGPLAGMRDHVTSILTEAGVECRPIVAGNFTKNPVIRFFDCVSHGDLPNSDRIDRDGFFIGNHHFDISEELLAVRNVLEGER